jgi:MULE transposase domain
MNCVGKLLVVDGTFNTNELRLPLLTSIGITNTGSSFPIALSYCPGETAASYNFFFESLRQEVFVDGVAEPGVVMGDQAAGLISSIDAYDSMPHSQLQFCAWHAAEAMKARWRKSGYTSQQIDGVGDEPGLADLTWTYLKSSSFHELLTNRQRLLDALKPPEVAYILKTWVPKEDRVVAVYTRGYPNLGATSTQRGESYHPVLRQTSNAQLPLEESIRRLIRKLEQVYRDLATDEDLSRTKAAGAVDMKVFGALVGSVTIYAIDKLRTEWSSVLCTIADQGTLGSCDCEILRRYGLPCKHYLYPIAQKGIQIPRSLLHPRWWLGGPVVRRGTWGEKAWRPLYAEEDNSLPISPKRKDVYRKIADVFEQRERLPTEARSRFDDQILAASERLQTAGIQHEQMAALPIGLPDPVPKKSWRRKNTHGRANARALTAAEVADRHLKAQERQEKKLRAATPESVLEEEVHVPATPEQEPPVSTAPARLAGAQEAEGRGKRKRRATEAYRQARHAGLQSLGYSQVE